VQKYSKKCDFCQKQIFVLIKHFTIPVFIPELACPFQCAFCNQRKISGHIAVPGREEIIKTVNEHLISFPKGNKRIEIGFFGGSFTGLPLNEQEMFLKLARPYLEKNNIQGIRLSTRPDYINDDVLALLKKYGVTTIELGAQSFDDEVLLKSHRGHTALQTEISSKKILKEGFNLGLQMMIGLPGDTLEKAMHTANKIIESGASCTRIYPTVVIKDTALHHWYKTGKYQPLTLEEAVEWTKHLLLLFEKSGVKVIRTGLHPSEGLLNGDELIDGPFHPSFKELVLTEIWYDQLKKIDCNDKKSIAISVPPKELNFAIGYQSKNKKKLLEKFSVVKFKPDPKLSFRNFKTEIQL
jgi:histone acetyltransferase (RNA polymerase elongator complex component)